MEDQCDSLRPSDSERADGQVQQKPGTVVEASFAADEDTGPSSAHPDGSAAGSRNDAAGDRRGDGGSLSTVNRAHMAFDRGGLAALEPKRSGGRIRENMTLGEETALLARFAKAAGAGEMVNAPVLASLTLQASERSLKCSLTQALTRPSPGWISAQYFLISAAHAAVRGCAIALAVVPKSEALTRSIQTSGSTFIAITPSCNADQCKYSLSICP